MEVAPTRIVSFTGENCPFTVPINVLLNVSFIEIIAIFDKIEMNKNINT